MIYLTNQWLYHFFFRYGFNSEGHETVFQRLSNIKTLNIPKNTLIGINLGKNKSSQDPINDYVKGIEKFGTVADYFVINISRWVNYLQEKAILI